MWQDWCIEGHDLRVCSYAISCVMKLLSINILIKYNSDFIASSHSHLPGFGDVQDIVQAEWLGMY